jgi:D-alanyl-D-alanine dipeptidase
VHIDPAYCRRGIDGALPDVWLREDTARRLTKAAERLREHNLGLLVLDGWRPQSLQTTLWNRYRDRLAKETGLTGEALDERAREFVTPPTGSDVPPPHSTGGAVDVTLYALDGQPLDMGGDFDELTDRSHPDHYERDDLTDEERAYRDRRRLLDSAMSSAGFWRFPTEWWHFEYGTASWATAIGASPLYGTAPSPRRSIGDRWRNLAYGSARFADESLRERDPARAAELEANERAAGRALRNLVASVVAVAFATLLAIVFAGDAVQNTVLGIGIAFATVTGTTWWAARGAREADTQRVLALSAIFMQNPGELRKLMQTDRLHRVLQNLLKTVLPTDDLGDSLWTQGVSPLVQRLRDDRYRRDQLYEVHLGELRAPLELPLPDGEPIRVAPDEWREIRAELSYTRPFVAQLEDPWVGLVFDPRGGPQWFKELKFFYREYMPLDAEMVDTICRAFPGGRGSGELGPRLEFAEQLCRPTLTIGETPLAVVDADIDDRGMAMQFRLPSALRRQLRAEPWARVTAGLTFPLRQGISVFPVYFPELTLDGHIVFEHGDANVTDVTTDLFFSVHQPFSIEPVQALPDRLEVRTKPGNWIFPGAGMVFSWRDGSPARGGTAGVSMFPRP